ncbi:MAG: YggT family protein [Caldicoprobacterales bacterium]|nr:YggT family protein [Clostridiales bacterium]
MGYKLFCSIAAYILKSMVYLLNIYSWLIVFDATLRLFTRPKDKVTELRLLLKRMADPINNIFRKMLRKMGSSGMPVDISPMVSLIAVWVVSNILNHLAGYYFGLASHG